MKLVVLGLVTTAAALAQVVEGTVVSAPDGAPLAGVKVELVQNGYAMRRTMTDSQGAFRFDTVAEGDYTAGYDKQGYVEVGQGFNDLISIAGQAARRPVHVTSGGNPIRLEARMVRLGRIAGRVTGGGKPVGGAEVQLLLVGNFVGQIARADARGEFHFQDVDAGTYIVSASPPKSAAPPEDEDGRKLGWARTWYPSAGDAGGAAKLVIGAGTDLVGEDIELRSVPVFRVSGRVLNVDGEPMKEVAVKAMPPEEFDAAQFQRQASSQADGSFEIGGLADGNWRLTAEAVAGGARLYTGIEETVAGHDVERIELRFVAPFTLTGKVVRSATATPAETKEVGVMLTPKEGGYHMLVGKTDKAGAFAIDNVTQGVYRFQPISPGIPYYLASVEMNGRDVTGRYVEITPGTLPVTITYRADGGTVRGTVEDCNGATVVLAPQDAALQYAEFIRQSRCGQGGRFEITALRPGEYYAFAFDKPVGMLEMSSFAGQWINRAVRVTVRPGEASDASLKVTERRNF